MEIFAIDPGGDGAPAELGSIPHLQNVVVESGDAHSALDYQSFQTHPDFARRKTTSRVISSGHRADRFAPPSQRNILDLAQFLSSSRRHVEVSATAAARLTA